MLSFVLMEYALVTVETSSNLTPFSSSMKKMPIGRAKWIGNLVERRDKTVY